MMKKFAALLFALVCISATSVAQKVASTPTAYDDLDANTEYAILVKSDKTATDGSGNLLYCNGSNFYVDCRKKSNQLGDFLSSTQSNYIFKVEKQSDGVRIKSVSANKYLRTGGKDENKLSIGDAKTFEVIQSGNGIKLKYSTTYFLKKYTEYVVNNSASDYTADTDDTYIGSYTSASADKENVALFEFYALEPYTTITYNYQLNGVTKQTATVNAIEGEVYPDSPITLPDYVSVIKPSGTYTASAGTSFNLECYVELPFETSSDDYKTYYYLGTDGDNPTLLTRNKDAIAFRAQSEANSTLNNIVNDLWYIKGNPFDGFYFYNVGSGTHAQSYYDVDGALNFGGLSTLVLNGGLANHTDKWKISKASENGFIIYPADRGTNRCWRYNASDGNIKFQLDDSYPNAFAVYEPTFSIALNNSAADQDFNFATTCLPFAVEIASENAAMCYGRFEEGKVELYAQDAIPANEGVVLIGYPGQTSITLKAMSEVDNTETNELKGTTTELTDLTNVLSFGRANGTGHVGFFKSTNSTLKANRAYIINPTAQSMALSFKGSDITGIDSATADEATEESNAPIYDLSGRRVNQVVKGGIYIQAGHKFMAR